jgi:hypothetical protein
MPGRAAVVFSGAMVAAILLVPFVAQAQSDPPNPLATVKALKCRFPVAAYATWKEGMPKAELRTQELSFELKDINVQESTANFVGTTGTAFVSAVLSGWSLYFVESSVGQMNITTVFAQEASPMKLKAVHARHGYLQMSVGKFIAEPSVSQSYGDCEIVP